MIRPVEGTRPAAKPVKQPGATALPPSTTETAPGLSLRAILLGLLLVAAVSFLTAYVEFIINSTQIGSFAPAGNALLPLLILALLVNPVLKRLKRRWTLPRTELIGLYVVMLAVTALTSCQFAHWVVPVATGSYYYATPENKWKELTPLIPSWWAPSDYQDIRRFYDGPKTGETVHWAVWWKPLLAWGSFILVFYLTFLCITVILRKPWIEHERLPFPLVQLPLELTSPDAEGSFFRSRRMWLGVLIPTFVHSLNGLHYLFPSVPSLQTRPFLRGELYLADRPLSALLPFSLEIYFCLIGFSFLTGGDVPFSMCFFYFLLKAECLLGAYLNWAPGGEDRSLGSTSFPLVEAQHVGAVLSIVLFSLWMARAHLRNVFRHAIQNPKSRGSGRAAYLSYGSRRHDSGLYPAHPLVQRGGDAGLGGGAGDAALPPVRDRNAPDDGRRRRQLRLGVAERHELYVFQPGRSHVSPAQKLAGAVEPALLRVGLQRGGRPAEPRRVQTAAGSPCALPFRRAADGGGHRARRRSLLLVGDLPGSYARRRGHPGRHRFVHVGQRPFMELQAVQTTPSAPSLPKMTTIAVSALFTWLLGFLRMRFLWWRLHPLGYAVSTMWAMHYMWFSIFVGSTASWLFTRFGGLQLYRQARPFFLGLVLGDFLMLGVWLVIDTLLGVRGFFVFGA